MSSPSMSKELVTNEHNEKRRDDDASENKLTTHGRDARSLAPDVVPQGAAVEHDVPDGEHHEEYTKNIMGGMPCMALHRDRRELVEVVNHTGHG